MKAGKFRQSLPFMMPKTKAMAIINQSAFHPQKEYTVGGRREESPISSATATADMNTMILVFLIFRIVGNFNCHAFCLNEPSGTAHGSKHDCFRNLWETLLHHVADK